MAQTRDLIGHKHGINDLIGQNVQNRDLIEKMRLDVISQRTKADNILGYIESTREGECEG